MIALIDEIDVWRCSRSEEQLPTTLAKEPSERKALNSWKEIAAYLGRGIRTLQRYHATLGFPVHHATEKHRSPVVAFSDEIDA